jgi:hypothetical protein
MRSDGFGFDAIFGADVGGAPSAELYANCVRPLVEGLFEGINGTVFAYGPTGAGKSYTMVGWPAAALEARRGGLRSGSTPCISSIMRRSLWPSG